MSALVCQKWEESERGWGQRPDGYSLHVSEADRAEYVRAYWARMPAAVPHEYSRPCGTPYDVEEGEVSEEVLSAVRASDLGKRYFGGAYPGSGGTDGWIQSKAVSS